LLLALLAVPRAAAADPAPEDVSALLDRLGLFSDGKGHFVALDPSCDAEVRERVYYGDGERFWRLRYSGFSQSGSERFSYGLWEPRVVERWKASVGMRDGRFEVRCDDRITELKPVPVDEAKALLAKARFFGPRWEYRAYALARDELGNYYYVDHMRHPPGNLRFRLWVGPRGDMKPQKMRNVISDSEGDIFATRSGELRLVLNKKQALWVKRKQRTELVYVPVERNARMIYTHLGPYDGMHLGTPCDDL